MKLNLGNKLLNIQLRIFNTPNTVKLYKELSDYFANNEIEGIQIKDFSLESKDSFVDIIPRVPYFEERLSGGDYKEDLEKIGQKYGVDNLGFVYWCYHK